MNITYLPEHLKYLHCNQCGKQVSTGFIPEPTDTPDKGIIIRAWIECPECIEMREDIKKKLTLIKGNQITLQ